VIFFYTDSSDSVKFRAQSLVLDFGALVQSVVNF